MTALSIGTHSSLWDVFWLFAIPVGGGIPAGVVLAKARGMGWLVMTGLYFLSDVMLAFLFEPFMMLVIWASQHLPVLIKIRAALKKSTERTLARYGSQPGPFLLVMIAFGVDPMTGRTAALAAGHNFITGWAIAIMGDMLFFSVIAISTLVLNSILGDGTWAAVIIMIAMIGIPALIRRFKKTKNHP